MVFQFIGRNNFGFSPFSFSFLKFNSLIMFNKLIYDVYDLWWLWLLILCNMNTLWAHSWVFFTAAINTNIQYYCCIGQPLRNSINNSSVKCSVVFSIYSSLSTVTSLWRCIYYRKVSLDLLHFLVVLQNRFTFGKEAFTKHQSGWQKHWLYTNIICLLFLLHSPRKTEPEKAWGII